MQGSGFDSFRRSSMISRSHSPGVFGSNTTSLSSFSAVKSTASRFSLCGLEELKPMYARYIKELKFLNTENYVLERHIQRLQQNDDRFPVFDINQEYGKRSQKISTGIGPNMLYESPSSLKISMSAMSISTQRSTLTSITAPGKSSSKPVIPLKLNISFRIELIGHELEDLELQMNETIKEYKKSKLKISVAIEEKKISLAEIKEARTYLENNLSTNDVIGSNTILTSEKYMKHMHSLLNTYEHKLRKIRLKVSTVNTAYKRLKTKLQVTLELGETIHAIDFEDMKLKKKEFSSTLEIKNKHLLDLKSVIGRCSSNLSIKHRYLHDLRSKLSVLNDEIRSKEIVTGAHERGIKKTMMEISKAELENKSIKDVVTGYAAPSVLEYAKAKETLREIQKDLKMGARRIKIQNTTINLLKRKLKSINKSKLDAEKTHSDLLKISSRVLPAINHNK